MFIQELKDFVERHDLESKSNQTIIEQDILSKLDAESPNKVQIELTSLSLVIDKDMESNIEYHLNYSILDEDEFPLATILCKYDCMGKSIGLVVNE